MHDPIFMEEMIIHTKSIEEKANEVIETWKNYSMIFDYYDRFAYDSRELKQRLIKYRVKLAHIPKSARKFDLREENRKIEDCLIRLGCVRADLRSFITGLMEKKE